MYIKRNRNLSVDATVFVSFETTDVRQSSTDSLYYKRHSAEGSHKTMGGFRL